MDEMAKIKRLIDTYGGWVRVARSDRKYVAEFRPDGGPAPAPIAWGSTPADAFTAMAAQVEDAEQRGEVSDG